MFAAAARPRPRRRRDGWMDRGFYLFLLLLIDSVCDNNCVHSLLPRQATISQLPIIMAFFFKKKREGK